MIQINSREDLEALNHVQTLESIADSACNELTIQTEIARRALDDLGLRTKEATRCKREARFTRIICGVLALANLYWMWRAVR